MLAGSGVLPPEAGWLQNALPPSWLPGVVIGVSCGVAVDWSPGVVCAGAVALPEVAVGVAAPEPPEHPASARSSPNHSGSSDGARRSCNHGARVFNDLPTRLASFAHR